MDYRALNINDFNALNQSEVEQTANLDIVIANMDAYVQLGRVERSKAFHSALKSVVQSISNIFA